MQKRTFTIVMSLLFPVSISLFSQINPSTLNGQLVNGVTFAVPFMTINPESRGGAMGDLGAATSPDVNSMHWNAAKFAFIEENSGLAISYSPWLRNLVGDIDLMYLTGYYRFKKDQVVAGSLRYFSLGDIEFRDNNGQPMKTATPKEYAIDVAYSRLFGEHFSGALAFRYIRSELSKGMINNIDMKAGQSVAADISAFYTRPIVISDKKANLSFGVNISNIGAKMTYSNEQNKDFIPTNLKIGGALLVELDENNTMTLGTDINKFLVPSRPIYSNSGDSVIIAGKNPDVGILTGMIQSFYDSPGIADSKGNRSVLKGELSEINYSIGMEYWYRKQFALRTGYFHESEYAGNRKFITLGIGFKLNVIGLDLSYLLANNNNPLANTLRLTLTFNFKSATKQGRS